MAGVEKTSDFSSTREWIPRQIPEPGFLASRPPARSESFDIMSNGTSWSQDSNDLEETRAFRSHLSMGSVSARIRNDFGRLPSGVILRDVSVKILEISPLHNKLEKVLSEPGWIG